MTMAVQLRACVLAGLVVLAVVAPNRARVYNQCDLAKALVANGIPRAQINDWVCLVESESSRNTAKVGGPNKNKSIDYGLFQINSRYWCTMTGPAGNGCNVKCSDMINEDISDDVTCALKIYNPRRPGREFDAWYGYKAKCKGKTLPDVSGCF